MRIIPGTLFASVETPRDSEVRFSSPDLIDSQRLMALEREVFLTTEEVLDYLQVNQRTVYRLIKAGKIPAVRVGRQWRFRKRDIDTWLDRQGPGGVQALAATLEGRLGILVVDDEEAIRDLLAKMLELADYAVESASDGPGALDHLKRDNYDLMFVDLKMPGMDGLALIRQARAVKPALPVIVVTGYSSEASAIEALNLGVSAYITKPFRVPQVLEAASRALAS